MPTIHKDFFAIAVLAVFVFLNQFFLIPREVLAHGSTGTYPYLINSAMGVFTLFYLLEALRRRRKGMDAKARVRINVKSMGKPAGLLVSIWLWVECVEYSGFLIPTFLLLCVSSLLYGERSAFKIAVLAVVAPLFILFFFTGLNSALPEGPLETLLLSVIRS